MWERVTDPLSVNFYEGAAICGLVVGLIIGAARSDGVGTVFLRGLEAGLLAPAGAFLAKAFISMLLAWAHDSQVACLAVGWGFFIWPGALDSLVMLLGDKPMFTAPVLLWTASVVGGFVGMMDGGWRIHHLLLGLLTFPLDVTWGLAGSTNGCLLHLINFAWGDHDGLQRGGAHRYYKGFYLGSEFAFTQGSVRSNLKEGAGSLMDHELVHVYQNRLFGPLFTLTYLGWMVLFVLPSLLVGAIRGAVGKTVEDWCYANNPWEAWAYAAGGSLKSDQTWSTPVAVVFSVLYFLGGLALCGWIAWEVWHHS